MRKYIKTTLFDFIKESVGDIWKSGFENTKVFVFYTKSGKMYLDGCRTCDEVTPLENRFKERQLVGNVYQSLCNCSKCGNYVVIDEHKIDEYDDYLKNKETIDSYSKSKIRHGLYVNISSKKLGTSIEPVEVIKCEPIEYKDIHRNYIIDTLFVYVVESHTDSIMDNPLNNYGLQIEYLMIFDMDDKYISYPYPESKIKSYPKDVQDIFNRYIDKYLK